MSVERGNQDESFRNKYKHARPLPDLHAIRYVKRMLHIHEHVAEKLRESFLHKSFPSAPFSVAISRAELIELAGIPKEQVSQFSDEDMEAIGQYMQPNYLKIFQDPRIDYPIYDLNLGF